MRLARGIAAALVFLLAACSPGPQVAFRGTDISHERFGKRLDLVDHNGVRRGLGDFKGKVVVLFFGYVHCPDVCPTTLSDVAAAMRLLSPSEAKRVQVLFVTVDPARDSADLLKDYVPYFHESFLGLRGSEAEVAQAAKEFQVFYRRHSIPGANGYNVDHTAGSYVLDERGKLRLLLAFAMSPDDMAHDLRILLRDG